MTADKKKEGTGGFGIDNLNHVTYIEFSFFTPDPLYPVCWKETGHLIVFCYGQSGTDRRMTRAASMNENRVLVIGGGIAGATVAERLGKAGTFVHLVEKEDDIGGHAGEMGCKATDVCLRCNVCVADEIFRSVRNAPNVRLHISSELRELQPGRNGSRFTAILSEGASRKSEADCVTVDADAVIIATGYQPYDPIENSSYRYGRIPNVITGIDAERQLAEQNRITRPSDGEPPTRVAFVQCVGSRTEEVYRRPEDTDYCSAVCCSYALRIGRRIKHQAEESDITVFYMDIQNFGKGFDDFYSECKNKMRFVRSRPYEMKAGEDGTVLVKFTPEVGKDDAVQSACEEGFDLVVLSVGIRPPSDALRLADKLGVAVDERGFFGLKCGALSDLQKEGIYVAGTSESPKDIAGCIAQAEAVSAAVLANQLPTPRLRRPGEPDLEGRRYRVACKAQKDASAEVTLKGVNRDVVVVGGGIAGMQAAEALAGLGHRVTLVHRGAELGGVAADVPELYAHLTDDIDGSEERVRRDVSDLARRLKSSEKTTVYPGSCVNAVDGELGDFRVGVVVDGKEQVVPAGAVVLACGSNAGAAVEDSGVGGSGNVVDMKGLVGRIRSGDIPGRVALVMDLAAEQGRAVSAQVLSAAQLVMRRFGARVKLYCNNVRVAATGLEGLYRRVREAGAVVAKSSEQPVITDSGSKVTISAEDRVAGAEISEEFDLVVVADLKPAGDRDDMVDAIAGLRPGPGAVLQYDDVWLLPSLTNRPGVFVVGGARGNSDYRDALTDGLAVACEVHDLLGAEQIEVCDDAATVDGEKCVLCLTCLRICPHGAISIDLDSEEHAAYVSPVSCRRCGICAAECPAQAITLPGYADDEVSAKIGARPSVTVFACENSAIPAALKSGSDLENRKTSGPAQGRKSSGGGDFLFSRSDPIRLIRVPCAGQVDPRSVLAALEAGSNKVWILGCHPESCQYLQGSSRSSKRADRIVSILEKAGFDGSKVEFGGIASVEANRFVEYMEGRKDGAGPQNSE